jgi:trk system potassium uptake protein TrkA
MVASGRNVAVIGLSKFGYRVAIGLCRAGMDVIAIDRDERIIQRIADKVTRAVRADALDQATLEHLGVFDTDVAVIGFRSSFDTAVLLTMMLRKRNTSTQIIAQVDTDEKAEALRLIGSNSTVFPEQDIADRVVKRLMTSNLIEHIEVAPDVAVIETPVPTELLDTPLRELDIRAKWGVHIIGVLVGGAGDDRRSLRVAPPADTVFHKGEHWLLLGTIDNLNRFSAAFKG